MVTASLLATLLSVREYKYDGGFDAGDCDDGGCKNGFDGNNGTMPMALTTAVLVVRE